MTIKQQLFLLCLVMFLALSSIVTPTFAVTPPPDPGGCNPGVGGINLGNCLKLSDSTKVSDKYNSVGFVVNLLVRNLFIAAGLILFFVMLFAAFKFISGGKKGAEEAKSMFVSAIVGFLLMFSAYWIIQIIKVLTGADIPI